MDRINPPPPIKTKVKKNTYKKLVQYDKKIGMEGLPPSKAGKENLGKWRKIVSQCRQTK